MSTAQVVVAGGGPVGMMLAAELALAGVRPVLLERLPAPSGQSRALGLHSRTVEVLDQRGLLDRFSEGAPVWPRGHFAGLRKLELSRLDGRHTYALMVPQSRTEQLLAEWAVELGAEVRRGHELVGVDQDQDGVTLTVRGPAGEQPLRADWLVGCDGGSSAVRRLTGIGFPGTPSTLNAVLGDVRLDVEPVGSGPLLDRLPGGLFGVVPLGGRLFRVVAAEFGVTPPDRDRPVTMDELRAAVRRVTGAELGMRDPSWLSRFGNATRQAESYRLGRVLLAGDAAHVHFPAGGQGLNTGIQDAVNLGWKLARTALGAAPPGLLDSYHDERHPVGHRVCLNTQAQLALMDPSLQVDALRDLFEELMGLEQVNRYLAEMITGLQIRYDMGGPNHPLTGRRVPDVELAGPGDLPLGSLLGQLRDGHFVLLDPTASAGLAAVAAGRPGVDVVAARPVPPSALDGTAALLVRPDGYVAWVGADPESLTDCLDRWTGPGRLPARSRSRPDRPGSEPVGQPPGAGWSGPEPAGQAAGAGPLVCPPDRPRVGPAGRLRSRRDAR